MQRSQMRAWLRALDFNRIVSGNIARTLYEATSWHIPFQNDNRERPFISASRAESLHKADLSIIKLPQIALGRKRKGDKTLQQMGKKLHWLKNRETRDRYKT